MAEVIGTISGITGLLTNVLQAIQQIEKARDIVRGKSRVIKNVAIQLDSIYQSLSLVRDEPNLQTAGVEQHSAVIIGIADELKAYFDRLNAGQQRTSVRQFFSALRAGDKDDAELSEILVRLDRAQNELILRISVAQVGLMGDMGQGFRVAYDVLMDTNQKCKKILGTELQLANHLEGRNPESNGQLALESTELQEMGLIEREQPNVDLRFCDNITLDQARIFMGNVGTQNWKHAARSAGKMKVDMSGNRFGNGFTLMVGDWQNSASLPPQTLAH